jgi:hypothetical protein
MLHLRDLLRARPPNTNAIRSRFGPGFLLLEVVILGPNDVGDTLLPPVSSPRDDLNRLARAMTADPALAPVFPLDQAKAERSAITVGRSSSCAVCLKHRTISKVHARFRQNESSGGFTISDAGSLNGTFVDGERLERDQIQPLRGGEWIRLGGLVTARFHTPASMAHHLKVLHRLGYTGNADRRLYTRPAALISV